MDGDGARVRENLSYGEMMSNLSGGIAKERENEWAGEDDEKRDGERGYVEVELNGGQYVVIPIVEEKERIGAGAKINRLNTSLYLVEKEVFYEELAEPEDEARGKGEVAVSGEMMRDMEGRGRAAEVARVYITLSRDKETERMLRVNLVRPVYFKDSWKRDPRKKLDVVEALLNDEEGVRGLKGALGEFATEAIHRIYRNEGGEREINAGDEEGIEVAVIIPGEDGSGEIGESDEVDERIERFICDDLFRGGVVGGKVWRTKKRKQTRSKPRLPWYECRV